MEEQENIKNILLQKVNGYDVEEIVEEYSEKDGDLVLVKKKITHKYIPPDSALLKLLLETKEKETDYSSYSEEELREMLKKIVEDDEEA